MITAREFEDYINDYAINCGLYVDEFAIFQAWINIGEVNSVNELDLDELDRTFNIYSFEPFKEGK